MTKVLLKHRGSKKIRKKKTGKNFCSFSSSHKNIPNKNRPTFFHLCPWTGFDQNRAHFFAVVVRGQSLDPHGHVYVFILYQLMSLLGGGSKRQSLLGRRAWLWVEQKHGGVGNPSATVDCGPWRVFFLVNHLLFTCFYY